MFFNFYKAYSESLNKSLSTYNKFKLNTKNS